MNPTWGRSDQFSFLFTVFLMLLQPVKLGSTHIDAGKRPVFIK
jgi:hypothetical protein